MLTIELASAEDRDRIYQLRHDVYATEIGQHAENDSGRLSTELDQFNLYLVARRGERIVGFVSITPPDRDTYSIDNYLDRTTVPELAGAAMYEVRLLTVVEDERQTSVAALLLYAGYRWLHENGAKTVVAIGRREVLPTYRRIGFQTRGVTVECGEATFELMSARIEELESAVKSFRDSLEKIRSRVNWNLEISFFPQQPAR